MTDTTALKARLHFVSKARSLTFSELAQRLQVPFTTLHSWIRGQAAAPDQRKDEIARELDCDTDFLWKGEELEIPRYKAGKATASQA